MLEKRPRISLDFAVFGVFAFINTPVWSQAIIAQSQFDTDSEGWSVVTSETGFPPISPAAVTWIATSGNPGGYMQHVDQSDGETSFWSAPAEFLGDMSIAYGGALRFDLRQSSTSSQYQGEDLILIGGGLDLRAEIFAHPRTTWTRYYIALAPGTWRVGSDSGPFATANEIQQVLADLTGLYVRAEYRSGADTDGLDNFQITESDPCPYSYFDSSSENWTTVGDASNEEWSDTIGNPPGSFGAVDLVDGILWHYVAPGQFLGDRSDFFGSSFNFDLLTNRVDADFAGQIVTFYGSGLTLQYEAAYLPVEDVWTNYQIPMEPSELWTNGATGDPVTPAEFISVLSGLSRITIRGEYWSGDDVGHLDNVHFAECGPCIIAGDVNRDNEISLSDVPVFAAVLAGNDTDLQHIDCADVNGDGNVDGRDIASIVEALLSL